MCLEAPGEGFSCFHWRYGRVQQKTIDSSKGVPENLYMKFRSKYNHDFTNHGCSHCTIVKALCSPKEKDPTGERYAVFPSKCSE